MRRETVTACVAVSMVSCSITSLAWWAYERYRAVNNGHQFKQQAQHDLDVLEEQQHSLDHFQHSVPEHLIREQLARHYIFFQESGMQAIRQSFVIVVGCGGVGSWAAMMLVRAGVGHVRLIDFDQVTLSSLNRHACAGIRHVGMSKVKATAAHLSAIAPWCHVEECNELWNQQSADRLMAGEPTWVIDAIDNLTTKVHLLQYCSEKNLQVFSSMGSGTKSDPTRIRIADISATAEDSLARTVRVKLKFAGVRASFPVVYSTEEPSDIKLQPLAAEAVNQGNVHELTPFDDFRIRILPVLGPLPAMFGLTAATYILLALANRSLSPTPPHTNHKTAERYQRELWVTEKALVPIEQQSSYTLPVSRIHLSMLMDDIYSARSCVAPFAYSSKAQAVRWNKHELPVLENLVCMTPVQARTHYQLVIKEGKALEDIYDADTIACVARKLKILRIMRDAV